MYKLKDALIAVNTTQTALAQHLKIEKSTVNAICKGHWPVGREAELKEKILSFLRERGINKVDFETEAKVSGKEIPEEIEIESEVVMITQKARKAFNLFKDPFTDEIHEAKDVYLTDSVRFVSQYMYMSAKSGGILAVIGESGSGKSTMRKLLQEKIASSGERIRVIYPETFDKTRLTVSSICDAIIEDVSTEKPRKSLEAKARQVKAVLTGSSRAGFSHVLIIEEAHDLDITVLKYLKRFWEMEDGFKRLLGVILIAQPELKYKLDESRNWVAREIIRRIEIAELDPFMTVDELKAYLSLKLENVGSCCESVFEEDAYKAILDSMTRKSKNGNTTRFCYPLSVNNLVKKAMNAAAEICAKVDAEIIKSV